MVKLVLLLLRSSWRMVVLASLIGGASGAASVAMLVVIDRTLRDPIAHSAPLAWYFVGLCAFVFFTNLASRILLTRLTQNSISQVLMALCRSFLAAPLRRLEEIGPHRILASLTDDVMLIAYAMNCVPALCVNAVILVFDEWAADQDPLFNNVFYCHLVPDLKRRGKAVLAITHDDRYFGVADRVIKLDAGKTVAHAQQDAPNEAFAGER